MASQSKAPAIGIDLGTTNSCVAVWHNNRVEIIADDLGERTTPSWVAFTDEDRLIGRPAKFGILHNPSVVFAAKRLIGRRFSDATVQNDKKNWPFQVIADSDDKPVIVVQFNGGEKRFYPEQVSAMVLERMREVAESFLCTSVKDAVVTVPAYFNDAQRQATKVAGTIAGLNIMQIINEPTAAALAYGFQRDAGKEGSKNVLVFDLGGGTFDVSLVSIKGSDYKVHATGGDTHLGGEDMNNRMMNYLIQEFKQKHNQDISNNDKAKNRLRMQCELVKCQLSASLEAKIYVHCLYKDIDFEHTVTRAWFENVNADLFYKCMEVVDKCLQDANIEKESVDDIVLVGGSTRIPMVQRLLKEKFGNKQLCKNINPDEAVAYGAAIQAALLNGVESKELDKLAIHDVTSISLGIEIDGGLMSILVPRNTRLPVKNVRKEFVTIEDNQTSVNIRVFQGEREMASENYMLAEFLLKDFAPAPRGKTKIYVDFNIDVNGHLQVSAVEESSGKKNCITVIVDKGRMSPEQIEKMTEDSERYKLRMYANKMGNAILKDDISTKVSYLEGKNITNAVEEALKWLQENNGAQVEEITAKLKQLKIICKAIDG